MVYYFLFITWKKHSKSCFLILKSFKDILQHFKFVNSWIGGFLFFMSRTGFICKILNWFRSYNLLGLEWWYHLPIYDLSYMWYSGVACMIVMLIGMAVSLIDTHEPEPVDPDLLAAGVETLFCCWPKRLKRWVALRKVFSSHKYVADHDCTIEMQSNTWYSRILLQIE